MKGDEEFRESSKSYIQFANEIFIYAEVLPEFEKMLKNSKITSIKITEMVAPCYKATFGYIEGNIKIRLSNRVYKTKYFI